MLAVADDAKHHAGCRPGACMAHKMMPWIKAKDGKKTEKTRSPAI